jgi:pterin-4a-carbinolamine dehydratase
LTHASEDESGLVGFALDWACAESPYRIERTYRFRNVGETLGFIEAVRDLAKTTQCHPQIVFGRRYVTVSLPSRGAESLCESGIIMASNIDRLAHAIERQSSGCDKEQT